MDSKTVYSTKAEKYARYRWDYAPEAIDAIYKIAKISPQSTVADIGAGTGILTKHFAGKVHQVFAIEPNFEMRQMLSKKLGALSNVTVLDGTAEDTKLTQNCVDVITAAQAIHWFDPRPAQHEMWRILKPKGWIVILRNYGTDQEKARAMQGLMTTEYGANLTIAHERPIEMPHRFYYGEADFTKLTFPFAFQQSWVEFLGALTTASFMPDEEHPLLGKLENKAQEIFSQYSQGGLWMVEGETELIIGQPER
jgi:SAM-dependent methyltransferase